MKNNQIEFNAFQEIRKEVLSQWTTGSNVILEEAFEYHKSMPKNKTAAEKLASAKKDGTILIQPRGGSGQINGHIELLQFLQDEGKADLLPTTIDTTTRHNQYDKVENLLAKEQQAGEPILDGFPVVNYGVSSCRFVTEAVKVPCQIRHATPDARLLAEISLAGGFTDFEGGGISSNIPYSKNMPLEKSIAYWQYVDRLVGIYEENGIKINREPFGALTGALIPPSISHSISILEALLAAEQGVKNITLGYGQGGNLLQDVAAMHTLPELAEEYLQKAGHKDILLTTAFHQWMGGFPQDESQAYGVISWGAVTAVLAKVTKILVKTPQEAIGIPTKDANIAGIKVTRQLFNMIKNQALPSFPQLEQEQEIIKAETKAIVDRVIELGQDNLAAGIIRAFESGVIDVPFAPNKANAGRVVPIRDLQGAVRLLDHGALPLTKEIIDFHREKVGERGRKEGRTPSYQMVVDDIYAIGKGWLVGSQR